jgi:hypothetical protein
VLCTPPGPDGRANAAVLVAARLCGIDTVFKAGGAQAIAAMAYGTQSVPKVDKIYGPGTAITTAAKQLVAADPAGAACDMPAGPSEVLVIADATADAEFVAADLLAQAEHDVRSQALLVTDSAAQAVAVAAAVQRQAAQLSRGSILEKSLANCRAIVVATLDQAMQVSNDYAPEHLQRTWSALVVVGVLHRADDCQMRRHRGKESSERRSSTCVRRRPFEDLTPILLARPQPRCVCEGQGLGVWLRFDLPYGSPYIQACIHWRHMVRDHKAHQGFSRR